MWKKVLILLVSVSTCLCLTLTAQLYGFRWIFMREKKTVKRPGNAYCCLFISLQFLFSVAKLDFWAVTFHSFIHFNAKWQFEEEVLIFCLLWQIVRLSVAVVMCVWAPFSFKTLNGIMSSFCECCGYFLHGCLHFCKRKRQIAKNAMAFWIHLYMHTCISYIQTLFYHIKIQ